MKGIEFDTNQIQAFLTGLESCGASFPLVHFAFIAFKHNDRFEIWRGRLSLKWTNPPAAPRHFASENICAGTYDIADLGLESPRQFVDAVLSGIIMTPGGKLYFSPPEGDVHRTHFESLHADGVRSQRREQRLTIRGGHVQTNVKSWEVDWELKGSSPPYDNLPDLCNEYGIGFIVEQQRTIEIATMNLAKIGHDSIVNGTNAKCVLVVAASLDYSNASFGYIVYEKNVPKKRGTLLSTDFTWTHADSVHRGEATLEVSPAAVMHCYAAFKGNAQHHYWIADPTTTQNPRRAAYETFDRGLKILEHLSSQALSRTPNADEFEASVANLLWILGFSVMHLGDIDRTTNAADILAATPNGNILVVECTSGLPKSDKAGILNARARAVRQNLAGSGNEHLRVLAILVTARPLEEVKLRREEILKDGVLLLTRDDFKPTVDRTLLYPDADRIFEEAAAQLYGDAPTASLASVK